MTTGKKAKSLTSRERPAPHQQPWGNTGSGDRTAGVLLRNHHRCETTATGVTEPLHALHWQAAEGCPSRGETATRIGTMTGGDRRRCLGAGATAAVSARPVVTRREVRGAGVEVGHPAPRGVVRMVAPEAASSAEEVTPIRRRAGADCSRGLHRVSSFFCPSRCYHIQCPFR